ncbi:hypothetical protein [Kitasatospora sp. NPDC056531]|uniref:hypothetical protein n=1 Tax=Kitasatospora sp. NPDC056531 TaxID=3345856 RepID=UPI003696D70D
MEAVAVALAQDQAALDEESHPAADNRGEDLEFFGDVLLGDRDNASRVLPLDHPGVGLTGRGQVLPADRCGQGGHGLLVGAVVGVFLGSEGLVAGTRDSTGAMTR